jgi:isopentenyldiphosphate isomerase
MVADHDSSDNCQSRELWTSFFLSLHDERSVVCYNIITMVLTFLRAIIAFSLGVAPVLFASGFTVRELYCHGLTLSSHSTRTQRMEGSTDDAVVTMKTTTSLAGPYVIECESNATNSIFKCTPIREVNIDRETFSSEGGQAWAALHDAHRHEKPRITLQVHWDGPVCRVQLLPEDAEIDASLLSTLSRVLVQWSIVARQPVSEQLTIHFPREEEPFLLQWKDPAVASSHLYNNIPGEMVEMVDRTGAVLGHVPRKLLHQHNLLHRGIGIFVTKDHPMNGNQRPDLYTHRRTQTKRIFPSLYDMFVGGVSLAGEDAIITARREVEEELGLSCSDHLHPERLLQCIVCTAYNRCVVDLFVYVMNTKNESIQWQDEEVAWGSFVPYRTIEAAADRSIHRLAERGEWPGRYPPIQSSRMGKLDPEDEGARFDGATQWTSWDFVPDGLLVWEAWLRHCQGDQ